MKAATLALRGVAWMIIALLVMPAGILAQDAGDADQEYRFSKEELTQMLAPIALYPDALTAQILMASTYPLEVVEADRWMSKNKHLKGDELDKALQDKPWDPSIKSLCHFPDILAAMSDKLDQTRKLGDAFLGQEEEVTATVQELRRKAKEQGTLKTTGEQKVIVRQENISIEPVDPEVVYVPVYDPAYVYGPWWYPAYPPYYWYYPPGFVSGVYIGFAPGIYIGFNAFSWVWFDWPVHHIYVDSGRTRGFDRYIGRRGAVGPVWRHNPYHRRGVAYRDLRTSERFGARPPRVSSPNLERRGYPSVPIKRQERGTSQVSPGGARTVAPQVQQGASGTRAPATRREDFGASRPRPEVRDTPFRGIGDGSFERKAGERGGMSTRGSEMRWQGGDFRGGQMPRPEGGGARGGGARR